jgi:hypothetical protein
VEIHGSRWCELQLTSVAESHSRGKQLFRCRLHTQWSLLAKVTFWSALGFTLLLARLLPFWISNLWYCLGIGAGILALVAFALTSFFRAEQRALKRLIVLLVDGVAKNLNLIKLDESGKKLESDAKSKPEIKVRKLGEAPAALN